MAIFGLNLEILILDGISKSILGLIPGLESSKIRLNSSAADLGLSLMDWILKLVSAQICWSLPLVEE